MKNIRLFCALFVSAASAQAGVTMTPLLTFSLDGWLSPADYEPLDSAAGTALDTTRGMACNPVTGRVIVVTRKGAPSVRALDGVTGAELHEMQPLPGGYIGSFFPINMCAVADDGVVFVSSLAAPNSTATLRVYRWENDNADTIPIVACEAIGVSQGRLGDDMTASGSGVNTQLAFGESASTGAGARNGFAVLTTADGTAFAGSLIVFPGTPPNAGDFRLGISFVDADTVIGTQGTSLRIANFTGGAGTLVTPSPAVTATQRPLDYAIIGGRPLLATVETSTSTVRVFDMTVPTAPSLAAQLNNTTPPVVANANGLGSISWGSVVGNTATLYAMNSNNGIQAFTVTVTADATAPTVTTSPADRSVYARGQTTFSVEATGTPPLLYQWFKDDVEIPTATAASYTVNPVTDAGAGAYKCRVSNAAPPPAESTPATLTVLSSVDTMALTETWHLAPGSRAYLGTSDQERGMDYHPGNNRLYVVTRSTNPPSIRVLDAANGANLHALDTSESIIAAGTPPGTYLLNMVGVGGDGVVYAASLSSEAGDDLAIYKWANDDAATVPEEIYRGNPIGGRIGDSMDVRGSGANTQILFGSRRVKSYVVFTPLTGDPPRFEPHVVDIVDAADAAFGHSIAFGEGNSVWGKLQGQGIVRTTFAPGATPADPWSGVLTAAFAPPSVINDIGPIGIDAVEGCLVGLENGNSDNARLYELPLPFPDPAPADLTLLDQEFLFTDNANLNGVGSIAVAGGKAFVLGTNNGLTAYTVVKSAPPSAPPVLTLESRTGDTLNMKLKGTVGKSYQMEKSSALSPAAAWTPDGAPIVLATEEQAVTRTITAGEVKLFYRAREQSPAQN